jgi:hypothetical protein
MSVVRDARKEHQSPESIARGVAQGILYQIGLPSLPNVIQGVGSGKRGRRAHLVGMPPGPGAAKHANVYSTPTEFRERTHQTPGTIRYVGSQVKERGVHDRRVKLMPRYGSV